jgi:Ca2+:H+ antiporter
LARESVFSTIMIVTTGVIGVCLTLGGLRHRYQDLKRQGTSSLLAIVIALSGLTLVLPSHTPGAAAGTYSTAQLALISLLCVLLYGSFILAQMTRHRDDFVDDPGPLPRGHHVAPTKSLPGSLALLLIGLIGIVLLAEYVAGDIERGLEALKVSQADAIVGAFIATLVLMPESVAAIKSSLRNELQHALNIALGSVCATIGLTIPVVAAISVMMGRELTLGLNPGDTVLLAIALTLSIVSFGTGRTSVMTGSVHLVIFVGYLLMIALP